MMRQNYKIRMVDRNYDVLRPKLFLVFKAGPHCWLEIMMNLHLLITPLCTDKGRDKNSSVLANAVYLN